MKKHCIIVGIFINILSLTLSIAALADNFNSRTLFPQPYYNMDIQPHIDVDVQSYIDTGVQSYTQSDLTKQKPVDMTESVWSALVIAIQEARLQTGNPPQDVFGRSVSVSDTRALVGAPDFFGENGAAYVFELSAGVWEQVAILTPPIAPPGEGFFNFGDSVSLLGNRALIGAPHGPPREDGGGLSGGVVYVFELSDGIWSQTALLAPFSNRQGYADQFGIAVSLSGDRALIGSNLTAGQLANGDFIFTGAAFIFDLNGAVWEQTAAFTAPDSADGDTFGWAVSLSLSGNRALIGAPQYGHTPPGTGAAYLYEFGETSTVTTLLAADGDSGDSLGASVSLLGNRALVAAPDDDNIYGVNAGSAYVWDFDGGLWFETAKILPNDGAEFDLFGISVSQTADNIVIGAPGDDDRGNLSGSAYLFELSSQGQWEQKQKILPTSAAEEDRIGISVSMSTNKLLIGAPRTGRANDVIPTSAFIFNLASPILIDPACNTTNRDCDGRYLQEINNSKTSINSGSIYPVDNPEILAKELSVTRSGIITDGVSQILLKIQSDEAVIFDIIKPDGTVASGGFPCKWGTLSTFGDSKSCSSVTVEPQMTSLGNFVFASYQAPIDFPNASANDETIISIDSVSMSGIRTSQPLELRPPPIVLIHGVWSDPDAWRRSLKTSEVTNDLSFESALREQGYDVFLVDHSDIDDSAGSFNPSLSSSSVVERLIEQGIENARYTLRQRGFAVSQVDLVGHSMGGLIARSRMAYSGKPYFSKENYHKGDFHKLITIGSPHQGSGLVDAIIPNKCVVRQVCSWGDLICTSRTLEEAFGLINKPIGAALYGFQSNSPTLNAIGSTDIAGHAIIGIAPPDSDSEKNLNRLFPMFNLDLTIDGLLGGNERHDTIVSSLSQAGGTFAIASTTINGIVHAFVEIDSFIGFEDDVGETNSQIVFNRVLELIKEPVSSDSFGQFGSLPSGGSYTAPLDCPNSKNAQRVKASNAEISFTPAEGAIVSPGDTVQIQFDITNGEPISNVLFSFNGSLHSINGPPPYSFEITAPANKAGRINIYAQTTGDGLEDYGVDSHIIVQPDQAAVSLAVTPFEINFTQPGRSLPLHVIAKYSDETEIDVSSGVAGTTYATKSGTENIISVNSDGVINAVATGEDDILISNSGQTVSVPVYVSTELKQEKVFANGFE